MATKKKTTDKPAAATPAGDAKIRVRVVKQPVGEDGQFHPAGSEFETTAARAAALGTLVEPVTE